MKKLVLMTAILASISTAHAATIVAQGGQSVSLNICNTTSTSAAVAGLGTSVSNAGIATGASAVTRAAGAPITGTNLSGVQGTISGVTNTYSNGFSNNVSTGNGVGAGYANGAANATAGATVYGSHTNSFNGAATITGNAVSASQSQTGAGTNQAGSSVAANVQQFDGSFKLQNQSGTVTATVADTKSGQSVVEATGPKATNNAFANGSANVQGVVNATTGRTVPAVTCGLCL